MTGTLLAGPVGAQGGDGQALYRECIACHQIGPDSENSVGPHLNDLIGRLAAGVEGYPYSKAMSAAGAAGMVWTKDTLDAFLTNPMDMLPHTSMGYRGMPDPQDRATLIAFLATGPDDATAEATFNVAPEILALQGDLAYGEYLSGDCTACHARGTDDGIPSISGLSRDAFVTLMQAYKQGAVTHPVMTMMAGRLSNEEIAALAAYFESVD
nr:c-type cytochrome [Loktanella sp. SALINAS62]